MIISASLSVMLMSSALFLQEGAVPAPGEGSAFIAQAREALDDNLVDYPRARFRNVRLLSSTQIERADQPPVTRQVFCGEINAPNRVGGMVGWRQFVLTPGAPLITFRTLDDTTFVQSIRTCDQAAPVNETDYSSALSHGG